MTKSNNYSTHQAFVLSGIVDEEVVKKQAYERATDKRRPPENTKIHYHTHEQKCVDKCYTVDVEKVRAAIEEQTS